MLCWGIFCLGFFFFSENNTFFSSSFLIKTHFSCYHNTECHNCRSPACMQQKRVNKSRTWPWCRGTHGACIIYKSNGPDDALMVAHMEVLAMLLTWLMKAGWRKPRREETTMGGAGQSRRGCQWAYSNPGFVLRACSVFCIRTFLLLSRPILKSTTQCLIGKKKSLHSEHFPAHADAKRNAIVRKASHKSSDTSSGWEIQPPAEATRWLSFSSVLGANRCFD